MHREETELPLAGIKVIEFSHMVMGPSTGVILADLGAHVVKVEPIGGDRTRQLLGSGSGYFPMYNRNKESIAIDLKSVEGVAIARALVEGADVLIENFRPGTLERLGLGPDIFAESNPGLIYYSAKGFLQGPYEHRAALDEVAQMMGGLAYMTGPSGRPLRAGASVVDVAGGMFGVIGILAALERRHRTGKGGQVRSSLYETTAFLVGQHIAQMAVTGAAARPMPERISAWAIYDVFDTETPGEQVFIGVVSDAQWEAFTSEFGLADWANDEGLALNNQRVLRRDELLPQLRAIVGQMSRAGVLEKLERAGVAYAPVMRPEDLLDDEHLNANGSLVELTLDNGATVRLPAVPVEIDGVLPGVRHDLVLAGQDSAAVLRNLGYSDEAIAKLVEAGTVAVASAPGSELKPERSGR